MAPLPLTAAPSREGAEDTDLAIREVDDPGSTCTPRPMSELPAPPLDHARWTNPRTEKRRPSPGMHRGSLSTTPLPRPFVAPCQEKKTDSQQNPADRAVSLAASVEKRISALLHEVGVLDEGSNARGFTDCSHQHGLPVRPLVDLSHHAQGKLTDDDRGQCPNESSSTQQKLWSHYESPLAKSRASALLSPGQGGSQLVCGRSL